MADDIFPLSDEEQQAVAAPPVATPPPNPPPFVAAPGTGFGYSTNAPSDWTAPQTGTMGGVPVMVPGNAQNVFAVRGPAVQAPMQDQYWQRIERAYQNLPLAQAEQAITAATQYQGIRAYERYLAQGMSASEALQKAGPMMFFSGRGGAAGMSGLMKQPVTNTWVPPEGDRPGYMESSEGHVTFAPAGSIVRPPKDIKPQLIEIGGVKYIYNPQTGSFKPEKGDELSKKDILHFAQSLPDMITKRQGIDPNTPEYALVSDAIDSVGKIVRDYRQKEKGAAPAPKSAAAPSANEVVRTTKDGRKAVFDATTKKFLRFAD